jgi:hypothetical protein
MELAVRGAEGVPSCGSIPEMTDFSRLGLMDLADVHTERFQLNLIKRG